MPRRVVIATVVLAIVAVALAVLFLISGGGEGAGSASSGPLSVKVLGVERDVEGVKIKAYEATWVGEGWWLCYPKSGLDGVLLRISVTNNGNEIYMVEFTLITSKGRQLGALVFGSTGAECTIVSPMLEKSWQKTLLEKAREYPSEMLSTLVGEVLEIAPGASLERILLFGLEPGEEPVKLHVVARSFSGVVEFDVQIKR